MRLQMMESAHIDEGEWPMLYGQNASAPATAGDDDGELLYPEESPNHSKESEEESIIVVGSLRSHLCAATSTPESRKCGDLMDKEDEEFGKHDDASSFALLSVPQSVVSVSSTFSFRDAILKNATPGGANATPEESNEEPSSLEKIQKACRQRIKPKFVVQPIKRCAKSTDDLNSLPGISEDEEVLGATDAMDFYHRKAAGAKSRWSARIIRPDEAKRLEITMNKKSMQREMNANKKRS